MAINKTLLLNMLMNSAPLLMEALTTRDRWHYGEDPLDDDTLDGLNYIHQNGYDLGIVEDYMENTKSNFPYIQSAAQNAVSQIESQIAEFLDPDSGGKDPSYFSDFLFTKKRRPKQTLNNSLGTSLFKDDYDDLPF